MADEKIQLRRRGRQVANEPQLTPEPEATHVCMLATAQIPLENPEKASAAE